MSNSISEIIGFKSDETEKRSDSSRNSISAIMNYQAPQPELTEEDKIRQENIDKLNRLLEKTEERQRQEVELQKQAWRFTPKENSRTAQSAPAVPETTAYNPTLAGRNDDYYPIEVRKSQTDENGKTAVTADGKAKSYIDRNAAQSPVEKAVNYIETKEAEKTAQRNQNLAEAQALWNGLTEDQRKQASSYAYALGLLADVNSNHDLNNLEFGLSADNLMKYVQAFEETAKQNGWNLNHLVEMGNREYAAAWSDVMSETGRKMAEHNPVVASGVTIPARFIGGLVGAGQITANALSDYPADYNSNFLMDFANASRDTVAKKLYDEYGGGAKGWGASFTYQTAMSWVDSMASRAILGPFSIYAMGMSAGSEAARNALKNGSSNERALFDGLANGVFEAFFEKYSFESFNAMKAQAVPGFKDSPKEFAKTVFKNWLKQSGVEASEEFFTETADTLANFAILDEHSDDAIAYRNYLAEGYSEEEAFNRVLWSIAGRTGSAALGGFMMGGLSSFVGSAMGRNSTIQQGQTQDNAVSQTDDAAENAATETATAENVETREQRKEKAVAGVAQFGKSARSSDNAEARNVSTFLNRLVRNSITSKNSTEDFITFLNPNDSAYSVLSDFIIDNSADGVVISDNKGNKSQKTVRMTADAVNRFIEYSNNRLNPAQEQIVDMPETATENDTIINNVSDTQGQAGDFDLNQIQTVDDAIRQISQVAKSGSGNAPQYETFLRRISKLSRVVNGKRSTRQKNNAVIDAIRELLGDSSEYGNHIQVIARGSESTVLVDDIGLSALSRFLTMKSMQEKNIPFNGPSDASAYRMMMDDAGFEAEQQYAEQRQRSEQTVQQSIDDFKAEYRKQLEEAYSRYSKGWSNDFIYLIGSEYFTAKRNEFLSAVGANNISGSIETYFKDFLYQSALNDLNHNPTVFPVYKRRTNGRYLLLRDSDGPATSEVSSIDSAREIVQAENSAEPAENSPDVNTVPKQTETARNTDTTINTEQSVAEEQNRPSDGKSGLLDTGLAVKNAFAFRLQDNEEAASAWTLISHISNGSDASPYNYTVTVRRDALSVGVLNDFIVESSATGINIESDSINNNLTTVSMTAEAVDGFIRYVDGRYGTSSEQSEKINVVNAAPVQAGEGAKKSFFDAEEQARSLAERDEKEEQERQGRIAAAGQTAVEEYETQLRTAVRGEFRKSIVSAYETLRNDFDNKELRNKFVALFGGDFYDKSRDEFFSNIDFDAAWQENLKNRGLPSDTKEGKAAFEKNIRISRLSDMYAYMYQKALDYIDNGGNADIFDGFGRRLNRERKNKTPIEDVRRRAEAAQIVEEDKKKAEQRVVLGDDAYFEDLERKVIKNLTDRGSAVTDEFVFDEMVAVENQRRYAQGLEGRIAEILKDDYSNKAVALAHKLHPDLFTPWTDKKGKAWGYDYVIIHNREISRRDYAVQEGLTKFREGILAKTKTDIRAYFNRKNKATADQYETRYDEPPEYVGQNTPLKQVAESDIPESPAPQIESQNPVQTVTQSSDEAQSEEITQEVPEVVKRAEEKANAAKRIETIGKEAYFGQLEAEVEKDIGGDSVRAVRDEMIKRESDARFELRRLEVIDELMNPSETEDALAIAKSRYSEQLTPAVSDNGVAYGYKGDLAHNRLASAKIDAINNYDFAGLRKSVEAEVQADVDSYFADKGVKFESEEAPASNESTPETTENISPDSEQTAQEQTEIKEKSKRKTLDETAEELSARYQKDKNVADNSQDAAVHTERFLKNQEKEPKVMSKKLWRKVIGQIFSSEGLIPADIKDVALPGFQTIDRMIDTVSAKSPVLNRVLNRILVDMRDQSNKERTLYLNALVSRVNDLHLGRKNLYDIAVEIDGETVKVRTSESGLAQAYAEKKIDDKLLKNLKVNEDKIKNAAKTFRDIYDEIWHKTHAVLKALGYSDSEADGLMGYFEDYMPHFGGNDFDVSGLAKVLNGIGIDIWSDSNNKLPNEIAGLTTDREPGKRWNPHAMKRTTNRTEFDAVGGFENYIGPALDVIFYGNNVQAIRALEDELHSATGNEFLLNGLRGLDSQFHKGEITQEQLTQMKTDLKKHSASRTSCSNFLTQLHEYANHFAGKKPISDRDQEASFGRKSLFLGQKLIGRINSNTVGGNFSVALTNFIVPFQALSEIGPQHLLAATWNVSRNVFSKTSDDFASHSTFLINRRGSDAIGSTINELGGGLKGLSAKTVRAAYRTAQIVDDISSEIIVRAAYTQEIANNPNATEESAMKTADHYARSIMAGRAKGEMPTVFNSGNTLVRLYMSFQLETTNQVAYLFKDVPASARKKYGDKWIRKMAEAWFRYALGSMIINQILGGFSVGDFTYGGITGRKAALDPIYEPLAVALKKKDAGAGFAVALDNLTMNAPILGNGRYGSTGSVIAGNIWDAGKDIAKAVTSDKKGSEKLTDISWALARPASYFVLPTGGYQIYKTTVGINSYVKGGKYSENGSMLYPVEKSDINVALFGANAAPNAKRYHSGEIKAVPARLVGTMNKCAEYGFSRTAFARLYAKLSGVTDNAEKKKIITQSSLSSYKVRKLLFDAFGVK